MTYKYYSGNGIVHCWGDNSAGQLGMSVNNQDVNYPRPVVTPSGSSITMVACGANFTAALAGWPLCYQYHVISYNTQHQAKCTRGVWALLDNWVMVITRTSRHNSLLIVRTVNCRTMTSPLMMYLPGQMQWHAHHIMMILMIVIFLMQANTM